MERISVVVCARNEENYIEQCLSRLAKQRIKPEIIVVDGNSKDRTVEIAKKHADKIISDNGMGIGKARDMGARAAGGEVVAYCDADSRPPLDWTERILKNIEGFSAISGPLSSYDGSCWMKRKFKLWADLFPRFLSKFGYISIWGANMAFKREALRKYKFKFRFMEDYNMGRQLRREKANFTKEITLPVSSRRFVKGFHRTCFRYYVINYLKMNLSKKSEYKGYFSRETNW